MMITMSLGIRISFKPLSFFNTGYITTIFHQGPPEIALKAGMSYEQDLAVLIHELAHLFLGHTGHPVLQQKSKDCIDAQSLDRSPTNPTKAFFSTSLNRT